MDLRSAPGFSYYLWVGISLILIFASLEPAGGEGLGLMKGLVLWSIQIGLLLTLLIALHISLQKICTFNDLNPWLKLTVSGLLGSALFVPLGLGIDYLFSVDDWTAVERPLDTWALVSEEFKGVVFPATLTWIAINAPRILRLSFRDSGISRSGGFERLRESTVPPPVAEFWSLIPKDIGTDVVYLMAELHYVRVVTTLGERLVLYNLKDAISDLESMIEGIQTHRSYWVAGRHASKIVTERGGTYVLTLDGRRVPVSRRKALKAREFLHRLETQRPVRDDGPEMSIMHETA